MIRRSLFVALLIVIMPVLSWGLDVKNLGKPIDEDSVPFKNRYVYINEEAIDKRVGLEQPLLGNAEAITWTQQHVADILTLDGKNFIPKTTTAKRFFTAQGYAQYMASLNNAGIPDLLQNKFYHLSAVSLVRPDITAQGLRTITPPPNASYVYVWQCNAPIILSYRLAGNVTAYDMSIAVELVRIPVQADDQKMAINGWKLGAAKKIEPPENTLNKKSSTDKTPSRFAF